MENNVKDLFNNTSQGEVLTDTQTNTIPPPPNTSFDSFKLESTPLATPVQEQAAQAQPVQPQAIPGYSQKVHELIDGKFAVDIADLVASAIFALAFEYMYNAKIPRKEFQLAADEKKTFEPILHEIIKRMNIDMNNPYIALAVAGIAIYGSKVATVMNNNKEIIEEGKEKKEAGEAPAEKPKQGRGRPRKTA